MADPAQAPCCASHSSSQGLLLDKSSETQVLGNTLLLPHTQTLTHSFSLCGENHSPQSRYLRCIFTESCTWVARRTIKSGKTDSLLRLLRCSFAYS